jgi:plasmid stabilization system protein ParE
VSGYTLTSSAEDDLFDIWRYIARDNFEAANRVEQAIYEACELLVRSPQAGHLRPDLTPRPVRFWTIRPFKSYVVIYDPEAHPLQVLRILHGGRNLRALLNQRQ